MISKNYVSVTNIPLNKIMQMLRENELFDGISDDQITKLASQVFMQKYKKGSFVFKEGDSANYVYIIYDGAMAEFIAYASSLDVIFNTKRQGEHFGETGVIMESTYPNAVVALKESTLIAIPSAVFSEIFWENKKLIKLTINQLISRLYKSAKKYIAGSYLDSSGKLAFTLLALSGSQDSNNKTVFVTQTELAAAAGVARQTAAKILGEWRSCEWISTKRGCIKILDMPAILNALEESELNF